MRRIVTTRPRLNGSDGAWSRLEMRRNGENIAPLFSAKKTFNHSTNYESDTKRSIFMSSVIYNNQE
jgi:hypothetical protein